MNNLWKNSFFYRFLKRNSGILIALLLMLVGTSLVSEYFLTKTNLINFIRQLSSNALAAMAITMCLIIGNIDLTIGSNIGLASVCIAHFMARLGTSFPVALICVLLVGLLCGSITGGMVAYTKMHPWIITLAMQGVIRGAANLLADGVAISVDNETFYNYGNRYLVGIPIPVVIYIGVAILLLILLNKTVFGRHMYAIGGNIDAAQYSGIKIKRIKLTVYMMSGLLAALAGTIQASRVYSGQPTAGTGAESDAIAAAVLGGTSFSGGIGTIGGTIIGVIIIGLISNALNLLRVSQFWQLIIKGIVILLAVYVDSLKQYSRK